MAATVVCNAVVDGTVAVDSDASSLPMAVVARAPSEQPRVPGAGSQVEKASRDALVRCARAAALVPNESFALPLACSVMQGFEYLVLRLFLALALLTDQFMSIVTSLAHFGEPSSLASNIFSV